MNTRDKGDLAVLAIAANLMKRGCKVALPFGDSWDYDLIVMKPEFRRVQVKYAESDGEVLIVKCRTHTINAGRITKTKTYTAEMIDVLAVYDKTTDRCFYLPISEIDSKTEVRLRLVPPKNGQVKGIRLAETYEGVV
jgi:hypothetical protein